MRKKIRILIIILTIILIGRLLYKQANTSRISTLPAKVEEITQAVKLSTLDISTEEIFKDTIGIKGAVLRVKARVRISFDIEHIPMAERNDTLFVQLPREIIDIYESTRDGYQVLDVWYVWVPNDPGSVSLTTDEENAVKQKIKQKISEQMYEKGYVARARRNALHSLGLLFSKFKENIVIHDPYPEGWRDEPQKNFDRFME